MADVTETSVVQVTLLDAAGYARTLNLDNPKTGLTLAEIKAAFQPAISGRWLYGRSDLVVDVQKAAYSTSTKIPIGGAEVVVTPSTLNMTTRQGSVVVQGAVISGAYITDLQYTSTISNWEIAWRMPEVNVNDNSVTVNLYAVNGSGSTNIEGTSNLKIYFLNTSIVVPITFNIVNF